MPFKWYQNELTCIILSNFFQFFIVFQEKPATQEFTFEIRSFDVGAIGFSAFSPAYLRYWKEMSTSQSPPFSLCSSAVAWPPLNAYLFILVLKGKMTIKQGVGLLFRLRFAVLNHKWKSWNRERHLERNCRFMAGSARIYLIKKMCKWKFANCELQLRTVRNLKNPAPRKTLQSNFEHKKTLSHSTDKWDVT